MRADIASSVSDASLPFAQRTCHLAHAQVYEAIRQELASGGRVYIVCPVVGNSTASSSPDAGDADGDAAIGAATAGDVASSGEATTRTVLDEYQRLRDAAVFGAGTKVGQLHGRMKGDEKARALKEFST